MRCVIEDWLPAPTMNGSRQKHWATLKKQADITKQTVWASCRQAGWTHIGDGAPKQRLIVTFVFGVKRRRDLDNLYARAKHVVDGIKPFIVDDDMEHLDLRVQGEVQPGRRATILELEEES